MISRKSYHLSLIVNQYTSEDKIVIENSMIDASIKSMLKTKDYIKSVKNFNKN